MPSSSAPASPSRGLKKLRRSLAFGVCIKDPRVDNLNDNPDTAFDETKIYSFLPQYM